MAILAAMQSAAIRLMGQKPTVFFGASVGRKFELEITDLINEVAQDVAKYQDWQALIRWALITGDGGAEEFTLPNDYDRMLVRSDMRDGQSWAWGYSRYTDINAFLASRQSGFTGTPGGWMIFADRIQFSPAPTNGATASYPYITSKWARASDGTLKSAFDADTDTFLLPERLLTLGLVWRWREQKKLDATGDQEAFIKALDEYAGKDKGSRIYRSNSRRYLAGTYPAWPGELG